jgi:dihydroorotate dehydrogenase (NAD+) catalytic subunit
MELPRYDPAETYRWNYDHAPDPVEVEIPPFAGEWTFAGKAVGSPLGIPAGPLLNGRWCLYYASLGFDVLTYKTVRSVAREAYPMPNLVPVVNDSLDVSQADVAANTSMLGSWAVSFGMPSSSPETWRSDVEWTRKNLPAGKLLSVSVVGTMQPGWSLFDLADDYAKCAAWAVKSGADSIEINLSCPNVSTCDGQLYQNPHDAQTIVDAVRGGIGNTPLLAKIGHLNSSADATRLLDAIASMIDALVMTNCVAARVAGAPRSYLFNGERRGIAGVAIKEASLFQTRMISEVMSRRSEQVQLIACGGAATAEDVQAYLDSGAGAVHIATAAMLNPLVALEIKQRFAG